VKIGCVCVSTRDQALDTQRSRLAAAGWKPAGSASHEGCRRVTKLDRLARSPVELLRIAEVLIEKHAGLQFLDEPWADKTSALSKMILTVFGGIAEFERPLILARMEEGRQAAKARGVTFGGLQSSVPTKNLSVSSSKTARRSPQLRAHSAWTPQQSIGASRNRSPYDGFPSGSALQPHHEVSEVKYIIPMTKGRSGN